MKVVMLTFRDHRLDSEDIGDISLWSSLDRAIAACKEMAKHPEDEGIFNELPVDGILEPLWRGFVGSYRNGEFDPDK